MTVEAMYDPVLLLAQARAWRVAAEKAMPAERDIYLSHALGCEAQVERSMCTPVIKQSSQTGEALTTWVAAARPPSVGQGPAA